MKYATSSRLTLGLATITLALLCGTPALAQTQPSQASDPVVLKVDVLLARSASDKKISSVPYSLLLVASQRGAASRLRAGVELPGEPSTTVNEGVTTTQRPTRFVGTSIDCSLFSQVLADPYQLTISIQDSALLPDQKGQPMGPMAIRTFSSSSMVSIRNGQTVTLVVGTDPITGETLRAEVALTVLK
jgi:hypothetical protein